jgi:hypothetical protein
VCLAVQQDRDLAASLHSALPLPTPVLVADDSEDDIVIIEPVADSATEESEEDALAEERDAQEIDA